MPRKLTPEEIAEFGLAEPTPAPVHPAGPVAKKLRKATPEEVAAVAPAPEPIKAPAPPAAGPKPTNYHGYGTEAAALSYLDTAAWGLLPATLAVGDKIGIGDDLKEGETYASRRDRYRKELNELQNQNRAASVGASLVGAAPQALAPTGKLGMAVNVAGSALQGANSATEGNKLEGGLGGAALGAGGEVLGKAGAYGARAVGRTARSLASGRGILESIATGLTGGSAKKQLEDRVLIDLIKKQTAAKKAAEAARGEFIDTGLKKAPSSSTKVETYLEEGPNSPIDAYKKAQAVLEARRAKGVEQTVETTLKDQAATKSLEAARQKEIDKLLKEYHDELLGKGGAKKRPVLTPLEDLERRIAKQKAELEGVEASKQGALGQRYLQDIGYVRDAVALNKGDVSLALQDLIERFGQDSAQVRQFNSLYERGVDKLGERLATTPEQFVEQAYSGKAKEAEDFIKFLEGKKASAAEMDPAIIKQKLAARRAELEKSVEMPDEALGGSKTLVLSPEKKAALVKKIETQYPGISDKDLAEELAKRSKPAKLGERKVEVPVSPEELAAYRAQLEAQAPGIPELKTPTQLEKEVLPKTIKDKDAILHIPGARALYREVYEATPGFVPQTLERGFNPLVRGTQGNVSEEDLGARFLQWLKAREGGIK